MGVGVAREGHPILGPTARACLAVLVFLAVAGIPAYLATGVRIEPGSALPYLGGHALLVSLWAFYRFVRKAEDADLAAEILLALLLFLLLTNLLGPLQYVAAALDRPLIDPWLAAADEALGIHVPALAAWTRDHPTVSAILTIGYFTLLPQFVLPFAVLGAAYRDLARLWEYVFHFHFCALVTVAALAWFPAECAFLHYGFESTLDQTVFIAHFEGLRDGSLREFRLGDLTGIISVPSFHAAGGMMVTWAFRGRRWIFVPLVAVNVVLIAATFMSGAHYFVDVIATCVLFGASLLAHRAFAAWSQGWGVALPSRGAGGEPRPA